MDMQSNPTIVYHIGAPFTDNDQMIWSLRKDINLLVDKGILLRRPKAFRPLISQLMDRLDGAEASTEDQQALLESIVKDLEISRLILSDASYMGDPGEMLKGGGFFADVGPNVRSLRQLFPDVPGEIFLCIRNPALLVPEAFNALKDKDYERFSNGADLLSLRWSDVIDRLQRANPDCPITVWCNEDTPIIWPGILGKVTGIEDATRFAGELDIICSIMTEDGGARLKAYLDARPQFTEKQRRSIRTIFLEKFVLEDAIEEEIDLPGLTEAMADQISEAYEDDVSVIAQMPGVTFLSGGE
ncbi:MAG: hypothetical protein COC12_02180 [Rhodobacteraceae bacterium]|nr:MAG: hypothetical protein COC12_02180 [Paracoccaceae bacterium]